MDERLHNKVDEVLNQIVRIEEAGRDTKVAHAHRFDQPCIDFVFKTELASLLRELRHEILLKEDELAGTKAKLEAVLEAEVTDQDPPLDTTLPMRPAEKTIDPHAVQRLIDACHDYAPPLWVREMMRPTEAGKVLEEARRHEWLRSFRFIRDALEELPPARQVAF
jgi:hypothetical protein